MYPSQLSFFSTNEERNVNINLQMNIEPSLPEDIVKQVASIEGATDVYFWYEGPISLPKSGAKFMQEALFEPLYSLKKDITLCLCSLNAWSFKKNVKDMSISDLGKAINGMNKPSAKCIDSSLFFKYCTQQTAGSLYDFLREALPAKTWLYKLSQDKTKKNKTVSEFFNNQPSLLDCIKNLDLAEAYSAMQYIEAYYLIRESVQRGLKEGQESMAIAFVLPNDESKYYLDLKKDIQEMLLLDFGKAIDGIVINITFRFFVYGKDKDFRPYADKQSKAVEPNEISSYFEYLPENDNLPVKNPMLVNK